eukprot:gene17359-7753_t
MGVITTVSTMVFMLSLSQQQQPFCYLRGDINLPGCDSENGVDTWTLSGSDRWMQHPNTFCWQGHGAVALGPNLGSNYTEALCKAACLRTPNCSAVCTPSAPPKPEVGYTDVFGTAAQVCTGAQMLATKKSMLVWGECQVNKNPNDLIIQLRQSTDWGKTWGPALPQPFPPPYLSQVIFDAKEDAVISVGPCPGSHPPPTSVLDEERGGVGVDGGQNGLGCGRPFPCTSKSTDEGRTWSPMVPVGQGNGTFGGAEGSGGVALASTGNIVSPFAVSNCSNPKAGPSVNRALISSDHGATWEVGGPTPTMVDGQLKSWGESMVAELANGSVVLTSRMGDALSASSRWLAFAISNDGGESWDNAWDFPANQPFDQGFGPGYNCEHGLLTAKNKTKLLLSKPTATLHGDANGEPHSRCSPGSCVYRRNLTISESDDGGASWTTQPWGLIYK